MIYTKFSYMTSCCLRGRNLLKNEWRFHPVPDSAHFKPLPCFTNIRNLRSCINFVVIIRKYPIPAFCNLNTKVIFPGILVTYNLSIRININSGCLRMKDAFRNTAFCHKEICKINITRINNGWWIIVIIYFNHISTS